nr:TM2 domain-containing protein [uncultured Campylobacter sp.]
MDGSSLVVFQGKVSGINLIAIKNKIDKVEAKGRKVDVSLIASRLSSPNVGLIISVFLGWLGSDRIYKGDMGLSVFKLFICSMLTILATISGLYPIAIVSLAWYLIDICWVYFGIKKDNFNKIMQALEDNENKDTNLTQKG